MSEVEQLESRVANLSPEDLAQFRTWFVEFDAQNWDRQIERDSKAGKLDKLVQESLAEKITR